LVDRAGLVACFSVSAFCTQPASIHFLATASGTSAGLADEATTGVVHQNVHAPKQSHRFLDGTRDALQVGNV
jgi:hypothetical protein